MTEDDVTLAEIARRLRRIEETMPNRDVLEERHRVADRRVTKLEESQTWMVRAIAVVVLTGIANLVVLLLTR